MISEIERMTGIKVVTIHKGMRFQHKRILSNNYDGTLLTCEVSKVTRGVVYFRPVYGIHDDGTTWYGKPAYIPFDKFSSIAEEK